MYVEQYRRNLAAIQTSGFSFYSLKDRNFVALGLTVLDVVGPLVEAATAHLRAQAPPPAPPGRPPLSCPY